jgi:hypothetical protein
MRAVTREGRTIRYVKKEFMTHAICLAAVRQFGFALSYVLHEYSTPDVCLAAVYNFGTAIQYVPSALLSAELCLIAMRATNRLFNPLKHIPNEFKTWEVCVEALRNAAPSDRKFIKRYIPPEILKLIKE